jgi:hypothetical protein
MTSSKEPITKNFKGSDQFELNHEDKFIHLSKLDTHLGDGSSIDFDSDADETNASSVDDTKVSSAEDSIVSNTEVTISPCGDDTDYLETMRQLVRAEIEKFVVKKNSIKRKLPKSVYEQ